MKIQASTSIPRDNITYTYPLGSVINDYIHIGSITLDKNGDGGQISEAQAKAILADALASGAEVVIKFEDVQIILNGP